LQFFWKDYVAEEELSHSSDDEEPLPSVAKVPKVSIMKTGKGKAFKLAKKNEEVRVYIDPPEEKADGDTDRDSGII
jgi:hypothetical protein